jgi:hypothetical protein
MEALLLVVEQNGPTMFARIATMRALHQDRPEPTPAPRRKSQGLPGHQVIARVGALAARAAP